MIFGWSLKNWLLRNGKFSSAQAPQRIFDPFMSPLSRALQPERHAQTHRTRLQPKDHLFNIFVLEKYRTLGKKKNPSLPVKDNNKPDPYPDDN
jgi:hypothetical protein